MLTNDNNTSNGTYLVIVKQHLKTEIITITCAEFCFLQAINEAKTFEQAILSAADKDENISIDVTLNKFIDLNIITGFTSD